MKISPKNTPPGGRSRSSGFAVFAILNAARLGFGVAAFGIGDQGRRTIRRELVGVGAVFVFEKKWQEAFEIRFSGCSLGGFGFDCGMSMLEQIEEQVKRLSVADQQALRNWLDDILEDELEFTDEFKAKIEKAKRDIAEGRGRVVKP